MKRHKGISRIRYPPPPPPPPPPPSLPVRKVVIYNRNDRKLPLDESLIRINETSVDWENEKTALEKAQGGNLTRSDGKSDDQPYDENYSIHSYRVKKGERKSTNYEIYESLEDDLIKSFELDNGTDRNSIERKARENFDLFTAREANKVYTLSNSVKDARKPKFHFESEPLERTLQKNVVAEEVKTASQIRQTTADDMTTKRAQRKVSDSIPVYETEVVLLRRKRSSGTQMTKSLA